MAWQVQEAKQKFSALVQKAIDEGPQVVTKHGKEVAVLLSKAEYERLNGDGKKLDLKEFLLNGPDWSELNLERRKDVWHESELEM
jgi:prevent-host-death family protein